jgi:phenylacetate-CoA ligase
MGCLAIPGGGMRSAARLRTIIETSATVLCCTPTYAIRLAEVAAEENIDLGASSVRTLIVAGEPGGSVPATRTHIAKLWRGARVVDHHGMTEIGPVSYGCPQRPGVLHVIEDSYIAEVIDPLTGQAVHAELPAS